MKGKVPSELVYLVERETIPWARLIKEAEKKSGKDVSYYEAFTDLAVELATKECMKESPDPAIITLGMKACLDRGRIAEALFLSTDSQDIEVLGLRTIALFVLMDSKGLGEVLSVMESLVSEDSPPSDLVRLSTTKVLKAAAERDTSVIVAVMEFDNLLEAHPEQVDKPLIVTMFTLYVVGSLLNQVGESSRAVRIAETLEGMAKTAGQRTTSALVENLRGNIANYQGDFAKAQEHYEELRRISEEVSSRIGLGMATNNMGTLMLNSLRLEEALEYFEESLTYMDVDATKLVTLANLGQLTTLLGRLDEATQYLKEAVRLEEKTESGVIEAFAFYAVLLAKQGKHSQASKYLEKTGRIAESSEIPMQRATFLHTRGVCEAHAGNIVAAIQSLEEALRLSRENQLFEILIQSKLEIARTHLDSFLSLGDAESLATAAYHLDDLIQIAKEQGLQALFAEALLLRSEIRRHGGRTLEAKTDLEKVSSVATFLADDRLEIEVKKRMATYSEVVPAASEIDQAGMKQSLNRVSGFRPVGKLREVPSPVLHALIALSRSSGLPEFVHYFDEKLKMDSSLLGGFVSAISVFSEELLGDIGLLRSINHEGFTLMMEHTSTRIVTLIANQETFDVRYRLHEFTQKYEVAYPASDDSVATADYMGASELVGSIFSEN
ncbi:MAG: tetratricopeptide repeat protein [Candidatus Thorarchaeota archaeon]|nr:MAG: tetratricopeptide repeat protein [Candidatus Thorarchaeota archaeon]